ncbi:MAG: glycosyl transferase [Planctomycetota bacterium]|nr:MAG: glycosyl transferase [Planctomycetota bacterium]
MSPGSATSIAPPEAAPANIKQARATIVPRPVDDRRGLALVSIVIPALNEAENLPGLLRELGEVLSSIESHAFEVIVIDDGSTDGTREIAIEYGARVYSHPEPLGNGASIKHGIREAAGDWVLLMDGDGQHPPSVIPELLAHLGRYDMVVASREGGGGVWYRNLANRIYNGLASYVTQKKIGDLTSGFRVVQGRALRSFVPLLPNTFSYPTTITLSMFRAGHAVKYLPFEVRPRAGTSKIRLLSDGSRFLLIILKIATFFAPLRVFAPLAGLVFFSGLAWYVYTFLTAQRFTNMAVLLLVQSTVIFSLGLISDQIAQMRFERTGDVLPPRSRRPEQRG